MSTVTLWLLVSLNSSWSASTGGHYIVLERFASRDDCEHVQRSLPAPSVPERMGVTRCIQAKVVRLG